MPLTEQNDVANSGIRPGLPMQYAGITCSVLPTAVALGKRPENFWVPPAMSPSGLNVKYGTRFDDPTYYTA